MASWFSPGWVSYFGGGGSKSTPGTAGDPTTGGAASCAAASYAEGGDQRRVASRSTSQSAGGGRGIPDDAEGGGSDIDDGETTLEVPHSAAQKLAAATSPATEPLDEDGISELVSRFSTSIVGSHLFGSGPFLVDEYVRAETTKKEHDGLKKTIENPEKSATVNITVRPAFDQMRFFVNPSDISIGASASAPEEVAEFMARGYIEIKMTNYPVGSYPPKVTGGGGGGGNGYDASDGNSDSSGSSGSSGSSSSSSSSSSGVAAIAASIKVNVPQLFPPYFCTSKLMKRLDQTTPASVIVRMMEVTVPAARPYSPVHGTN